MKTFLETLCDYIRANSQLSNGQIAKAFVVRPTTVAKYKRIVQEQNLVLAVTENLDALDS